ncbi:MAG: prepilin peptidase [Acidobacteriaceae bacterium]|jgi:leader peptidase (prepilin peptidase)/N-methyltransferase|nr:prepilin peptidase [Acidobacteriaceae bacterium]
MTIDVALAALFGAMIGSFLNVCIYRLPRGKSVGVDRSRCTACDRQLAWFDNIPLVSFIVLSGRCRTCRERISIRYPIVELLTAILFAAAWWYYGPEWLLVSRLVLGCALIVLFAIDLEHHLLPNVITLPGIVVGFALSVVTEPGWQASLLGLVIGGGVLYAIAEGYYRLRHEEGVGMGDVKMLSMIGAFLGWPLVLVTLMLASLAGSIVGLGLIATGRGSMKYALPFGTFLAMGAALAATVGPSLLRWYIGLLR